MPARYTNIHGRKPGRGLRPWLLIPKILCFCLLLGGAAATLALTIAHQPATPDQWQHWTAAIRAVVLATIVPGASGAIILGLALLAPHWRIMLRMRWLQVKLALVAIGIPAMHLTGRFTMEAIRHHIAADHFARAAALHHLFAWYMAISLIWLIAIVILGRQKLRLGQNWARTHRTITQSPSENAR